MSLSIIRTTSERLVSPSVSQALRAGIEADGAAVLLVPSHAQAFDAHRALSRERGLTLGVTVTTPDAWVRERWEVWGDGRSIAGPIELMLLAREAIAGCPEEERHPLEASPGIVQLIANLVARVLPWLPIEQTGKANRDACQAASLTEAESRLIDLAGRLGLLLQGRGLIGASEASVTVVRMLAESGAVVPHVVLAGYRSLCRSERELVRALAQLTNVSVVVPCGDGSAFEQARSLVAQLGEPIVRPSDQDEAPVSRHAGLTALRKALFGGSEALSSEGAPVEMLLAAGPLAEAELVTRALEELAHSTPEATSVVVAVPDLPRARRELFPRLARRGLSVRMQVSRPLLECPAAQAFFAFAQSVANLAELDDAWPEPAAGWDGPMVQLGDMSWWPPRELTDFMIADIAHAEAARGWRMDAQWRGNRLLTPAKLLTSLQSERDTSGPVARATQELLRGRIGSAASKLLQPYVSGGKGAGESALSDAGEAQAVLQAILSLAGTLHELGVTADPASEHPVSLSELVSICMEAAEGRRVSSREEVVGSDGSPHVRIMGLAEASRLAPGSADVLLICGLTTREQPIGPDEGLATVLPELLGIEPVANPMARAREQFHALLGVPRERLLLERTLHDEDSKETYPSVMLSELLAAYGISAQAKPQDIPFARRARIETALGENLPTAGAWASDRYISEPAPAGRLTHASRGLVFVPRDGSAALPGNKPVLSASQIETYLDCPYKWFSLRRLRLGQVDAGHTGMEMGTFAHRVLEVTHRELLLRALEREASDLSPEESLAALESDPARHVPGSRIDDDSLDAARELLAHEFELHRQHMYMVKRPRQAQQLLVAHSPAEVAQEERLLEDLTSSLAYQTRILQGFEPRLFEWSFGRHDDLVEYAGAYITGTVDRIDVSPHGTAVIIDYKHKSPVGFNNEYDALQEGVLEGERLPNRVQSLIYAQVVRRSFEDRLRLVGTVFLSTKSPHALAGAADADVADLVFGRLSSRRAPQVSVPRSSDGGSGMNQLLDQTEELVAREIEQMLAGNVEARPRDRHSCDFCPVMQCERRVAR